MNYLAHATLAKATDDARLGSLLGDFAKGLDEDLLPADALFALDEHRAVDRWFDALPEIRAERLSYPPELRRFSGILIDVFFDHFLVRRWDDLVEAPLASVTESLYRALRAHAGILPPRLARAAPSMMEHDWLGSYGDVRNVERALLGIQQRLRRKTPLSRGLDVLAAREGPMEALVMEIFPRVQRFTEERREDLLGEGTH